MVMECPACRHAVSSRERRCAGCGNALPWRMRRTTKRRILIALGASSVVAANYFLWRPAFERSGSVSLYNGLFELLAIVCAALWWGVVDSVDRE